MDDLRIHTEPKVADKFDAYPDHIKEKIYQLRTIILEAAKENSSIDKITETLKWGEPSYITKKGSTIRIDWKPKTPAHYSIYFKCTSKLVPTFKKIHKNLFNYEKNRAIKFGLDERIPVKALKQCINMALQYHDLKNLPLLGHK